MKMKVHRLLKKKTMHMLTCKISGFCHGVVEAFTLLGCYTALVVS